jgi:GrpB-like predicted nucleotidyltransferase (UPF0157 family)
MVDPTRDPIEIESPRYEAWRGQFAAERDRVRRMLAARDLRGAVQRLEHVGSTAVPGLPAKDVVDLDVIVADDRVADVSRAVVGQLGGDRHENHDGWHPVFRRHDGQRFNVHVFGVSDPGWRISVVTRDVLRARPDLRDEYAALKRDLADDADDLEGYSVGKSGFVTDLLRVARDDDLSPTAAVPDESDWPGSDPRE